MPTTEALNKLAELLDSGAVIHNVYTTKAQQVYFTQQHLHYDYPTVKYVIDANGTLAQA